MLFGLLGLILPILTSSSPTWYHFGAILGHLGPILAPFWVILGPFSARLGPLWRLSWAILGSLGAVLGPCWAISALSGRLLGPFFAISEPRSTLIGHSGRIGGHLGTRWGPVLYILGPIWAHLGTYFRSPWGLLCDICFAHSNHNPQVSKGGRRCIAASVLDAINKNTKSDTLK